MARQTSDIGIETLEFEEGVVLRAYRDLVGKWTIGAGLTAASGVVTPKSGMVITAKQSKALTKEALRLNYEPAVNAAMQEAAQHEFDAGISFHWNTGAINRASWVKLWAKNASRALISAKYRLWNKAGGKTVKGLSDRRERELKILFDAEYPVASKVKNAAPSVARWVLPLSNDEKAEVLSDLMSLTYLVGSDVDKVHGPELRRFQSDHGLTVDGLIGRATVTTLQRMINARASAKVGTKAAAVTSAPAATSVTDIADEISAAGIDPVWLWLPAGIVVLWALLRAWHYRDAIAVRIQSRFPKFANFLRSY